jgi:BirA family biotin operon repressor/biotin-[acetyl-CoA-carboxylase] ligase
MITPSFPPLFTGRDANGNDPFALACATAEAGCDAGLVIYDLAPNTLRAAIVFAPDVSLARAAVMLPICGVGFQNALGALAPPEVVGMERFISMAGDVGLCIWRHPVSQRMSPIGWSSI